ncbi:MAG TPA: Trk system potassium transporter TrkA [Candidatus Ozemobacteraceae bacterium]|nr:Trk system potassium transporter TrkA [Candidatus Ozemobacteraceae bacterium]
MRIVLSGGGEISYLLTRELSQQHDLFVIEPDPMLGERFRELDVQVIQGVATNLETLRQAEVSRADFFIGCAHSDEVNIISCLAAKQIGKARTVCFVNKEHYFETFQGGLGAHLAIDCLLWPEKLLAEDIARIITVPGAVDVEVVEKDMLKLIEFKLGTDHPDVGKPLRDLDLPKGTLMVALVRDQEVVIPGGATRLAAWDKVVFFGTEDGMRQLVNRYDPPRRGKQEVIVVGGGNAGMLLAECLEAMGNVSVRLIELAPARAQTLASRLSHTMVLNADGTDMEFLSTQQMHDCDCLIALTTSDERNLLLALMARQLKARKIITRVANPANQPLFERVGVDVALSSRLAAVRIVTLMINSQGMNVLNVIEGGKAEVLEIQVPERFPESLLKEMKLPDGVIIGAIRRGAHLVIPHGDDLIRPGDFLRAFCKAGQDAGLRQLLVNPPESSASTPAA